MNVQTRGMLALGRLKVGHMSKTEAASAEHLEARERGGEILWFKFEAWKLRFTDNTFYLPDFAVMGSDGHIECHEVEGFWWDDVRVKIKVVAALHPSRSLAVRPKAQKDGGNGSVKAFE